MESLFIATLAGTPVVTLTVQYLNYRKKHPEGPEESCYCLK